MDTSALRKLANTLKPLMDIIEVLEKIEGAEQQLASIQGRTVAAQRDYDALMVKMARDKNDADTKMAAMIEKATSDALAIVNKAKADAEAVSKTASDSSASRLAVLKNKIEKAEKDSQEWDKKILALTDKGGVLQKRVEEAEAKLLEIRAAFAAVRI